MTPFHERRQSDLTARHRWRNTKIAFIALTLATAFAVYLGWHGNQSAIHKIQASRAQTTSFFCGISAAVIDAGRNVITGSAPLPRKLERFLEHHGYPPPAQRRKAAAQAATRYGQFIASTVANEAGAKAARLVRRNGSLNCRELGKTVRR